MRLKSVKFSEYEGTEQEWTLDGLCLGERNLLVGKNASGKTRTLNVINSLAKILAGWSVTAPSAKYDVDFMHDGERLRYEMECKDAEVIKERFTVGDEVRLDRGEGGEGTIWAEQLKENLSFQTPPSEFAAVVRRDSIQHKFLEPLYEWGSSLRIFRFGTALGKDDFAAIKKRDAKLNKLDPNKVVALYLQAVEELGSGFEQAVKNDMVELEYDIEDMGVKPPISIHPSVSLSGELLGLYVKEKDLAGITDQPSMSQGMFRALSILVQFNYSEMAKKATCILVDDIGEGLDFDRSCLLIDLLRRKSEKSGVQLVLSTNDRFVMNKVPLKEWSVLQRRGGNVKVCNYENSRDVFEDFKFTGLSNFSFLEMDFISGPSAEREPAHE